MDIPTGLKIILVLLALGICGDVAIIMEGGSAWVLILALFLGRLGAIWGILKRSATGWWLTVSFFVVIVGLNVVAAILEGHVSLFSFARVIIPGGCLVYLLLIRSEFD